MVSQALFIRVEDMHINGKLEYFYLELHGLKVFWMANHLNFKIVRILLHHTYIPGLDELLQKSLFEVDWKLDIGKKGVVMS
jgi:hypothetical protein